MFCVDLRCVFDFLVNFVPTRSKVEAEKEELCNKLEEIKA